ncbi:hypothetical protein [Aeoliella mucimassa]|uniref:PEP-CTERM protein-sorting domain-containing protein n=1 Tax=Aeoliella mucimassa TaxID=2527972 RepID=A0A518AK44_9BACT|nr:hypothetical protein [Aeoliella mucimassa]QDU55101.1 hypothetical protein Pan181_12870 [Aeoliella mucimassa]
MKYQYLLTVVLLITSSNVTAAIIYESATLGTTGIPREDVSSQIVPGANINPYVFQGVRFELTQNVVTTSIGGHFVGPYSEADTVFGAIVALEGPTDFPNSNDLSTPDVLGTTLITVPLLSDDVYGDLELNLAPGWYALVFGSGLFEAEGRGAAVLNNTEVAIPAYIGRQLGTEWYDLRNTGGREGLVNFRFTLNGTVVPEPSTQMLLAGFFIALVMHCTLERRFNSNTVGYPLSNTSLKET